jgi:DNA replication protein DnaC
MKECVICGEHILGEHISGDLTSNNEWCQLCRFLSSKGLPQHYLRAKKTDFDDGRQKLFESRESLFIYGKVGTGKTWLASALMREQARINTRTFGEETYYTDDCSFVSLPEFAVMIRDSMDKSSSESEAKIIHKYSKPRTLFFDDIGAEKTSDYIRSILFVLIERRNTTMGNRTVITSNLSLSELDKEHGARIASRISEMCRVVRMTGVDRRIRES